MDISAMSLALSCFTIAGSTRSPCHVQANPFLFGFPQENISFSFATSPISPSVLESLPCSAQFFDQGNNYTNCAGALFFTNI
jgi:hypothetical protein